MTEIPQSGPAVAAMRATAAFAGAAVVLIGVMVLFGWAANVPVLKSVVPGLSSMKANTALCLVMCGTACLALRFAPQRSRLPRALGAIVALVGAIVLIEDAAGTSSGIDQLLFRDVRDSHGGVPGRMASATAFCFVALGAAIIARARNRVMFAQLVVLPAAATALLSLLGYVFEAAALYRVSMHGSVALPTAVGLLVSSIALLALCVDAGFMRVVVSDTAGGLAARRFFPPLFTIPIALGWLQHAGWFGTEFGVAILTLGNISVLMAAAFWSTRAVVISEAKRAALSNTVQQQALEALAASERARSDALAAALLESAPDAMVVVDSVGAITFVNARAARLFDYAREELVGQPVEVLVPDAARAGHAAHRGEYGKAPASRAMGAGRELAGRRKDGSEFQVEISLSPLETPAGRLTAAAIRDVSDRTALDRALRQSLAEKEVLLQEIHHRVKNNLAVVASLLSLQARRLPDPSMRSVFDEMRGRVHSIALVHERLYRSKNLAEVGMQEYLDGLTAEIRQTHDTGGRIVIAVSAGAVALSVDQAVPIGLIVNELITNAYKHAFAGRAAGRIDVMVRMVEGDVEVTVADNGVGVPADVDPKRSGTLGLSLVATLARQLDAEATTAHEQGTRWTLKMRRAPAGGATDDQQGAVR